MSILIKGKDMPEFCYRCPCNDNELGFCRADKRGRSTDDYRPSWCPLVEIPTPHGRLIDAEVFENDAQQEWGNSEISNGDWINIRERLNDAPTIIEAEE